MEIADLLFPLSMQRDPKFNKLYRLHTPSIYTNGISPFQHPLHPTRPVQDTARAFLKQQREDMAPKARRPSYLPTCSACSSARWQRATANDSVLFCCTPAFTDSRLFMLSNIWACCSAMVLGEETDRNSLQSRDPGCPSATPHNYLDWKWKEIKSLCRLWLSGSGCVPLSALPPSAQGKQKRTLCVQPRRKHVVIMAQPGAPSSRPLDCL